MAGKRQVDPMSEAAMEVENLDRQREEQAKQAQAERDRRIAECHEAIGRVQGFQLLAKFGDVTNLVWLKDVKDSKVYRDLPGVETWDKFCEYLGIDRHTTDQNILNLSTFGEDFLVTATKMRVGYRDLRKLRQLTHNGAVVIDAEFMVIGEERIPLDADHKEDLQAAIETIIEQQAAMQAEVAAQKKAFDRVQKDTHDNVVKLQRELDKVTKQAEVKGLTSAEEEFVRDCEAAQVTIQGLLDRFDPSVNPLPEDATPRMRATMMHTLAWFKRCVLASFDTAGDLYGLPEMDGGWMPPHLRESAPMGAGGEE